jgi:hypothetical protein
VKASVPIIGRVFSLSGNFFRFGSFFPSLKIARNPYTADIAGFYLGTPIALLGTCVSEDACRITLSLLSRKRRKCREEEI